MRLAALALFGLAACQPTQTATPRPEGIPLPQLAEEDRGDPICGPDSRWNGTRCLRSDRPKVGGPTTAPGLKIVDVTLGSGKDAQMGDLVSVDYTASLMDGTVVDSSRSASAPARSSRASSAPSSA